ncbi:MAG: Rne/Rng family ribonuclease [Acidimicrobiia bacterium]
MALFRRKAPTVVRKGDDSAREERKLRKVGRTTVEVRRVTSVEPPTEEAADGGRSKGRQRSGKQKQRQGQKQQGTQGQKQQGRQGQKQQQGGSSRQRRDRSRPDRPAARRPLPEVAPPATDGVRRQMLVRVRPHQTQAVVMEGPSLVEHFVASEESESLAGNVYLAVVRNVLPGMEAAFLDFGAPKNGVLYAGDVKAEGGGKRKPRIEEALRNGDKVLVQVVKDAMGTKGARLTGEISVPGRYLVLVPDSDAMGISRRLPDEERRRLREIIREAKPAGFGVIVRTAAAGATEEQIRTDIERLVAQWEAIAAEADSGPAPRLIHEEPELLIRVIREHFTDDFRRLLIDDEVAAERVRAYLDETAPDLVDRVKVYEDTMPLFERFHVEDQLRKALDRRVYLKSGGHLVIDRTEALTVIDVNTGKFVGSSSLEETVLQNNLEAAEEIGRQLRLRDIGGIIVIDFIDMESERNQRMLMQKFREVLALDKTRTQVYDVSPLGLVEMTRKNVARSLLENFSEPCPHCDGRGVLLKEDEALRAGPASPAELAANEAIG